MAGGATIDHIIAVTVLLTAMLVAMMTFNGLFAQALEYDTNRQISNKAVDIMNTICLSPGSPPEWAEKDVTVSGFGLQDPDSNGYTLSPYSIMRLRTVTDDSQLVEYPFIPGVFYNNISANYGHNILTSVGDCVDYNTASDLLGLTGEYGFSVDISPTLVVNVFQVSTNPLKLNVDVKGSGLPLAGATLDYCLFNVGKGVGELPAVTAYSDTVQTTSSGSVEIEFSDVKDLKPHYSFTVYVSLGGLTGVGYFTQNNLPDEDVQYIIPLIQDFDDGKIIVAHNWDDDPPEVTYNATFFILTSDFQFQPVLLDNSTGILNSGAGKPFITTKIPVSEVGLLVISYRKSAVEMGSVILPWGVGTLGVSASFDSSFGSSGYNFVATEVRQVTINGVSYQVKVSVWKLGN